MWMYFRTRGGETRALYIDAMERVPQTVLSIIGLCRLSWLYQKLSKQEMVDCSNRENLTATNNHYIKVVQLQLWGDFFGVALPHCTHDKIFCIET